MTCDEARIQAYLDGELSRDERKELARHLEACAPCRTRLAELKRLEAWVDDALHDAYPPVPEPVVDVDKAWKALEARLQAREEKATPVSQKSRFGRWSIMAKTYQKWLAGAAVVALMSSSLMIPQVKAATTDFLHLFRVESVQMLAVTPQDIQDMKSFMQSGKLGERDLNGLGKLTVDGDKSSVHQQFASAEEAKKAGIKLPAIPEGAHVTAVTVEPGRTAHLQLDVQNVNNLLDRFGSAAKFSETLDQKPFAISWPQMVDTTFTAPSAPNVTFSYSAVESPKLQAPADVDLAQLRQTVLSLPFLPDHIRQQLASIEDWQSTLPIPYMTGTSNAQKTTVNGANGVFLQTANGQNGSLVWQQDGLLHQLSATVSGGSAQNLERTLQHAATTWK